MWSRRAQKRESKYNPYNVNIVIFSTYRYNNSYKCLCNVSQKYISGRKLIRRYYEVLSEFHYFANVEWKGENVSVGLSRSMWKQKDTQRY